MITIKFSHKHTKMPASVDNTYLVDLELVNIEDLTREFIRKDTEIVGGGHYNLPPKGTCMILWLFTTDGLAVHRWQTIRWWTPQKEGYYRSHLGEQVNIEIEEG